MLTVNSDTIPPKVVSAGGLKTGAGGFEVGVIFDETVDPSTVVAGNFKLATGSVTGARHLSNPSGNDMLEDGAVLTVTGVTAGSANTLTVTGVKDAKGNAMAATAVPVKISTMSWVALGNNPSDKPAAAIPVGDNGFDVNSGGNAFWGTEDDATFIYEEITGDFDKVLRVEHQDPASQWARCGITAREGFGALDTEAARYQNSHVNPAIMVSGQASNNSWETNRRLQKGGATSSSNGGGTPQYPNAWVRIVRSGDVIYMYRSDDNMTYTQLGATDFNPADGSLPDGPLPAKMYVGPVYSPENGNLTGDNEQYRNVFAVRFRDYGNFTPTKPRGVQTYSIGLAFGRDDNGERGGYLGKTEIAGVDSIAQANWNNYRLATSENPAPIVADKAGTATATSATVEWASPNTWSSTGRGEENNVLTGSDHNLMVGYLDTGNATTTKVTVHGIPSDLTGGTGYDVIVYAMGGVAARGGGYRVTDINGNELKPVVLLVSEDKKPGFRRVTPTDPAVNAPGNYVVFKGLKANEIIIEGSTENGWGSGGTPRGQINAIQLVSPSGAVDQAATKPEISIARSGNGATITYKGTLQKASTVNGTYSDVTGATSPYAVTTSDAQSYFRARQ